MEKSNIMIRLEKKEEQQKVENLVRESFWNVYRPGCLEHYVLHQLRNDPAFVPELDFVMFLNENGKEDKLIGQNMFMRTSIRADDGRKIPIMTMGPICITPELKRQGYGKALLDYSLEKAAELVKVAHPDYRPLLLDYMKYAAQNGGHTHHCLSAAFAMHDTYLRKGDMRLTDWAEYVK